MASAPRSSLISVCGRIRLLTNRPRRIAGLEGYGLEVVEQLLLEAPQEEATEHTTH